eukprot:TRINITY_DN6822_c0_g1_i1.p1 TRINITY_DN6822_c0_g1~~TRINITY_DN6822_c0_g1_i1.p1  ORF type:complete len:349 (+),score=82.61 TRINITY_DN6822_c0_g1_i1:324-1370(+)
MRRETITVLAVITVVACGAAAYTWLLSDSHKVSVPACPEAPACPEPEPAPAELRCGTRFVRYVPSAEETRWIDGIEQWQWDEQAMCNELNRDIIQQWLSLAALSQLGEFSEQVMANSAQAGVLSRFEYEVTCGNRTENVIRYIEPLMVGLRHPDVMCIDRGQVVSKGYLVFQPAPAPTTHELVYFDMGASQWDKGGGGNSQQYLSRVFALNGFHYKLMHMWDAMQRVEYEIVPIQYRSFYHYHNSLANANEPENNPFLVLEKEATEDDYVVVKLDIDNASGEMALVNLMKSPRYLKLVDEFIWEHHTSWPPMKPYWDVSMLPVNASLAQSYRIFSELRHLGVRAHGWV